MPYTKEERSNILEIYLVNNNNAYAALREYRNRYPNRRIPDRKTFINIARKFRQSFTLDDKKRVRNNQNEELQLNILLYFEEQPKSSIRDAVRDLNVSYGVIQRVLKKNNIKPYKIMPVQKLLVNDGFQRINFCQTMINKYNEDADIFKHVFWTDESTFTTAGMFNRKNSHVWSQGNSRAVEEIQFQGRRSINVWCGILDTRIYFILYEGSLTGRRYLEFLQNQVDDILSNIPLNQLWRVIWQQDGAPCHNTQEVTNHLNTNFAEWIGRRGTILWPPRSPDLTPLDFFLWGYLKNKVYKNRVQDINELMERIIAEITQLNDNPDILQNVLRNISRRYQICIQENGLQIEHLLQ